MHGHVRRAVVRLAVAPLARSAGSESMGGGAAIDPRCFAERASGKFRNPKL
jgi:hypothetical protein